MFQSHNFILESNDVATGNFSPEFVHDDSVYFYETLLYEFISFTTRTYSGIGPTNQRLRSYYAEDMGLDYIRTTFIPQLKAHGFTDGEIRQMCSTNAGKLLDFA